MRRLVLAGSSCVFLVSAGLGVGLSRRSEGIEPWLVVDPNTAPPGVLLALPRLGPALVGRIVQAREVRPFDSFDDLDERVRGIGPTTASSLRPFLWFDGPP